MFYCEEMVHFSTCGGDYGFCHKEIFFSCDYDGHSFCSWNDLAYASDIFRNDAV